LNKNIWSRQWSFQVSRRIDKISQISYLKVDYMLHIKDSTQGVYMIDLSKYM